jgi:demethoxyubiquinone hydroxylase (CLK1/Coq7/Cat5 family)
MKKEEKKNNMLYMPVKLSTSKEQKKKHMAYHDGRMDKNGRPTVCSFIWTQK